MDKIFDISVIYSVFFICFSMFIFSVLKRTIDEATSAMRALNYGLGIIFGYIAINVLIVPLLGLSLKDVYTAIAALGMYSIINGLLIWIRLLSHRFSEEKELGKE